MVNDMLCRGLWLLSLVTAMLPAKAQVTKAAPTEYRINLSGSWQFSTDPDDVGVSQKWFAAALNDNINLPGSMATNGKGDPVSLQTPWTGSIVDSSFFNSAAYAKYRQPGNIKVPFWLQPLTYYKGAAWYRKPVTIPPSWKGRHIELFIERSHWETTVWVDAKEIGSQSSLGTPHVYDLTDALPPGSHFLTVRVDNRVKSVDVGQNAHSITDHTQTNWNGMIGQLYLAARPAIFISDIQVFPDLANKLIIARIAIGNGTGRPVKAGVSIRATLADAHAQTLQPISKQVDIKTTGGNVDISYPMGGHPLLWDEFHPNLYRLKVRVTSPAAMPNERETGFGMRLFSAGGTQFAINGRLTFLRGTLECAAFPKTGFPPTDADAWMRIFTVCRSYGLNHLRFHSWCPPEAAFEAADRTGFYLHVECSSWANQGATIGDGKPLDEYIYEESRRIVQAYGNHPSFCMMAFGNEPAGKGHVSYLTNFVQYWKKRDGRRLYTTAAGWPVVPENDYNSTPKPRIQQWGEGTASIINSQPPASNYDWSGIIAPLKHPTVSHEIGQWCVYPDFKEMAKYNGVLKARNFEIFQEQLVRNGMGHLADSFLLASGKLQALCYKADIEAALRTPGFAGFQLLGLYDFPGQGTALVGVLNPFWDEKGYITGEQYRQFCNAVVPLAKLPKMVYLNNEALSVPVDLANFGEGPLTGITPAWEMKDASGNRVFSGQFAKTDVPLGNGFRLGVITQSLAGVKQAGRYTLSVTAGRYINSWDIFIYPAVVPLADNGILVTQQFDATALKKLHEGGKVLLSLKKGALKDAMGGDIKIGFSSIFWNTAWTNKQPPHTLGILCDPANPALQDFPTQYFSNWQWWDAMSHSNAILINSVQKGLQPVVRVIDDWFTARPLALVFECSVGKGKLLVSGIDLLTDQDKRPEARQLLYSLQHYMQQNRFAPAAQVDADKIAALLQ